MRSSLRLAWMVTVGAFTLFVLFVPLFFLLYAASGAILGILIIVSLAIMQIPFWILFYRWLPLASRQTADDSSQVSTSRQGGRGWTEQREGSLGDQATDE